MARAKFRVSERLLALLACTLLAGACDFRDLSPADSRQSGDGGPGARRVPLAAAPPDTPDRVFYRGTGMARADYELLLAREYADFAARLKRDFGRDFQIGGFKNFMIAGPQRATSEQRRKLRALTDYVRAFYEQVYPRFYRYEPGRPFRIVYFATGRDFRAATGSPAYGFYRPDEHVLYTYLNSGHGTLWHELIHAFAAENARHSLTPQWFSEGFASFYEMAFLIDGRVSEGYTNWRLPQMQADLRADRVAPLRIALARPRFRMLDRDISAAESSDRAAGRYGYAEARFLFCYLWMHGHLERFVRDVSYEIRPRVLGEEDDPAQLGPAMIQRLEALTGKSLEELDLEIRRLALRLKKNEKLRKSTD